MDKKYLVVFVSLIVFFIVFFSFSKITELKTTLEDSDNNYEYHIIYYDFENNRTEDAADEEEYNENYGDYYDDPIYNNNDNVDSYQKEETSLPIDIYKNGNEIHVYRVLQSQCSNPPCEKQQKEYIIKFSKNGQEVIDNFITTKFENSEEKEITLYKNNLTTMEKKIIRSIIHNDESYLA